MSFALTTSRDGIARHWPGTGGTVSDNAVPGGWDAFRKMAPGPRAATLDQEFGLLCGVVLPGGNLGHVTCPVAGNAAIVQLTRPAFDAAFVDNQMPFLRAYADLRLDRLAEIQVQTTDILSFFGALFPLDFEVKRRSLEIVSATLRMVGRIEMRLKMHFDFPRPHTVTPDLQPMIQTPGHASWPSGHATEAFAVAVVLTALSAGGSVNPVDEVTARNLQMRLAARIATNRTVAGVHFPADSMAGAIAGLTIGETVVRYLSGAADTPLRQFDGSAFTGDFDLAALDTELAVAAAGNAAFATPLPQWLMDLWSVALSEWG